MNKFLAGILVVLSFSCQFDKPQSQELIAKLETPVVVPVNEMKPTAVPKDNTKPYELKMKMNELEKDVFELELNMLLFNGAHFVSPNAKRAFKGKFTVHLDDSDKLIPISELIENPRSVEEYDPHPFVNGDVNWVREDTKYTLKLMRKAEKYFSVKGFIQFTIEPRCTLEKIPIIIKNVKGKLRVELFQC